MSEVTQFTPAHPLNTPVLFLVFNRLDTTKQVFEAIRQAKPPRLYVAADGARVNKEGEAEKVQAVRDTIMQNIDWECEVKTLFREQNLGCKYAVSGAITWFFENEEQGIILEDDCLPSQSFFWYCEDLLERYKDDQTVYVISGDGRATNYIELDSAYDFCKYPMIWGWASWRRVWQKYDVEMINYSYKNDEFINSISNNYTTRFFWKRKFDSMYDKKIDTWDYQFSFLLLSNQAKCILPKVNLITNIGFGLDATHTFEVDSESAAVPRYEIEFPLLFRCADSKELLLNQYFDDCEFPGKITLARILRKIKVVIQVKLKNFFG
jgi:hypothetical protein